MGLKIISGFIIPSRVRRRGGQAFLDLNSGQFHATTAFNVSDHRVSGRGRFVRKPHVVLGLRRIGAFLGSINNSGDSLDYDLGDSFHRSVGGVPTELEINWAVLRHPGTTGSRKIAQDNIKEISYLIVGDTDEPAASSSALLAAKKSRGATSKRGGTANRKATRK